MVQVGDVFVQHKRYLYSPEAPSDLLDMVRIIDFPLTEPGTAF